MSGVRARVAKLHRGQLMVVSSFFALGSLGAGALAISSWNGGGQACAAAREFADSLASNRARLAALDTVIERYDLEDSATVIGGAAARGSPEADRLEQQIVALRMQGVTAAQLERWLRSDLKLVPRPEGAERQAFDAAGQVAKIRKFESDTVFLQSMRRNRVIASGYWHDMTALPALSAHWTAQCAEYGWTTPLAVALCLAIAGVALLCWRWWFVAQERS